MLGIIRIIGVVLFVYLTWRNLRENYEEERVVTYSWLALLGFFIGGRITYGLVNFGVWNDSWLSWFSVWDKPGMNYIGGFLTLVLVGFIFAKVNNWKVIPFLERLILKPYAFANAIKVS
jgi:prolipoprotein diacylglyceryltransferase